MVTFDCPIIQCMNASCGVWVAAYCSLLQSNDLDLPSVDDMKRPGGGSQGGGGGGGGQIGFEPFTSGTIQGSTIPGIPAMSGGQPSFAYPPPQVRTLSCWLYKMYLYLQSWPKCVGHVLCRNPAILPLSPLHPMQLDDCSARPFLTNNIAWGRGSFGQDCSEISIILCNL